MRWTCCCVVLIAACSSRDAAAPPPVTAAGSAAVASAPVASSFEDTAYAIDKVLCSSHFDNSCHSDEPRRPHRWGTGAVGLDWDDPRGIVLAKLSLVGGRWVGDLWFASDIDPLVDDKEGVQRPPDRIMSVDTGVLEAERRFEYAPIVGLAYTADGFVLVAGSSLDIPGTDEIRKLDGRFLRWNAGAGRFEPTTSQKITMERQGGKKVRRPGWVD